MHPDCQILFVTLLVSSNCQSNCLPHCSWRRNAWSITSAPLQIWLHISQTVIDVRLCVCYTWLIGTGPKVAAVYITERCLGFGLHFSMQIFWVELNYVYSLHIHSNCDQEVWLTGCVVYWQWLKWMDICGNCIQGWKFLIVLVRVLIHVRITNDMHNFFY